MATRKRKSGLIFFLLALLLIIILVVIAYFMRDQLMAMIVPQAEEAVEIPVAPTPVMSDIVVVIQPVKRGATLTEAMLGTVSYPQEDMVEGLFFTDDMDVIGKKAKHDLEPGMPLTPAMLSETSTGSLISFEIPPGMVAITIPFPSARYAVSYALEPGDHVNVLAGLKVVDLDQEYQTALPNKIATIFKNTVYEQGEGGPTVVPVDFTLSVNGSNALGRIYQDPSIPDEFFYIVPGEENQRPRWITQTVVQDAVVLWVGDLPLEDETIVVEETVPVEGEEAPPPEPVVEPTRLTVAVPQQDAVSLNYLILAKADINFVLRSAGDEQLVQTEAVTLQFIMDQYNIPYPSKLPYGLQMFDFYELPAPAAVPAE